MGLRSAPHLVCASARDAMLFLCLFVTLTGCSTWSATSTGNSLLKPPRMSPDSVVLEFVLLEVPEDEVAECDRLWRNADEQHLPTDLRRNLALHGLRCGVIGAQLPAWVRQQVDSPRKNVELKDETGMASISESVTQGRVHCRAGQRRVIEVADSREELSIDEELDSQIQTMNFEEAKCEFALMAEPQGDGRVQIELTPEISHGPPRQRWVGSDGLFRVDLAQDRERFEDSQMRATLSPGQTLLVGAAPDAKSIGKAFFLDDAKSGSCQRILLVRLAQTQCNDLFAPERTVTPTTTPGE